MIPIRSILAAAALTVVITSPARGQRPTPPDTTDRIVDKVFEELRGTDRPGCALGVSRNGTVVLERGYGMANLETWTPITPGSIFHVASVSKQFTAMAVMMLAREGRLSLDDDIRTHLPEMPAYGTTITIRHLLTHTSGLRDQWALLRLARGRFEENRITEADVLDIATRQRALNFAPGAEYVYSNTGYTLAAVIVKRVSGQSLRDFAEDRIFKPLGMTHTHFHDDYHMLVPGRTSAYARRGDGWRVSIPNFDTYGATSLFTTVGDLLKWEANFDSLTVGDSAMFAEMEMPARLTSGDTTGYGLGLAMSRHRGARVVGHGGADAGYRSYVGRYPEHGLAIAIACNASTANTGALAQGVAEAYLRGVLAPADTSRPPVADGAAAAPLAPAELQRRAGAYLHPVTLEVVEIGVRDGHLIGGRATGPRLVPVGENRFRAGAVEVMFTDDGIELRRPGSPRPVRFERRPAAPVSRQALEAFAGEYYSPDLDARYRVSAGDSTLTLVTGTTEPITARPVFADGFRALGYTIQFVRRGSRITGFEVTDGRMRRVPFSRVPSSR
jgi:CubicO group peptidase (beta-lactamase class C family)